jgi:hypothetical protein
MADTHTAPTTPGSPAAPGMVVLPVVPLADAVLLPGTVATLTLDTDDTRAAVANARSADGRVIVVPYL